MGLFFSFKAFLHFSPRGDAAKSFLDVLRMTAERIGLYSSSFFMH
jgi:hypothetical protein